MSPETRNGGLGGEPARGGQPSGSHAPQLSAHDWDMYTQLRTHSPVSAQLSHLSCVSAHLRLLYALSASATSPSPEHTPQLPAHWERITPASSGSAHAPASASLRQTAVMLSRQRKLHPSGRSFFLSKGSVEV